MAGQTDSSGNLPCVCAAAVGSFLLDGSMEESGTTRWTAGNNATLSKTASTPQAGSQALRITYNGTNNPSAYQAGLIIGNSYRLTGYGRSDLTATPRVSDGTTTLWTGTAGAGWQEFDLSFVATGENVTLIAVATGGEDLYSDFDTVALTGGGVAGGRQGDIEDETDIAGMTDSNGNLICKFS